jgi:hypothetical protein
MEAKISESISTIKALEEINSNLYKIIYQLKEHANTISEGIIGGNVSITDSIEKVINLNENTLVETFDKEGENYDNRMKKIDIDVHFNHCKFFIYLEMFKNTLM